MGSQKLTARYARTADSACPAVGPNPVIMETRTNSTTPKPPGVIGMAARMLASPYAIRRSTGEMKWLKAATNTHSEAASSSQLAAAQPIARLVSERFSMSTPNRWARCSTSAVVRSASRNRIRPDILRMSRLARSCPRVSR